MVQISSQEIIEFLECPPNRYQSKPTRVRSGEVGSVGDRGCAQAPLARSCDTRPRLTPRTSAVSVTDSPRCRSAWARAFDAVGFDGVWHTLRYTTTTAHGVALFGPVGTREDWPVEPRPRPLRDVVAAMPITVLDVPRTSQVTVVRPPGR
jgi:hypothetical protein